MVIRAGGSFHVHAHVECRNRGRPWWRYARPALGQSPLLVSMLTGANDDGGDEVVPLLGVPADCSADVRDEYTYRVAGDWALAGDPRTLDRVRADEILRAGITARWTARDPVERIVDPAYEHATWIERRELERVLRMYERVAHESAPATYCAALAMMTALESDYEVRLILWLERLLPTGHAPPVPRAAPAASHAPR